MNFQVSFKINENIFVRDPEASEIGKVIVKKAIDLIHELGFEKFTFKKLATEINSTEASIYRYFENKHRLLLYIVNWYWKYIEFLLLFQLQNISEPKEKLNVILNILSHELPANTGAEAYNMTYLNKIVIAESSKVYLVKEVAEINKYEVFKPYKDLCANIAKIISEAQPSYQFPHSLGTTLIETAHQQQYFSLYLPSLTDVGKSPKGFTYLFLKDLLFNALNVQ